MSPKVASQTYCLQKLERVTTTVNVPKTLLKCQSLSDQGSLGRNVGQGSLRLFSVGPLRLCRLRRAYRD